MAGVGYYVEAPNEPAQVIGLVLQFCSISKGCVCGHIKQTTFQQSCMVHLFDEAG